MSVPLVPMRQLAEAIDKEDDWTGLTDIVSRRKRQTRLNVRAYRRRKALEARESNLYTSSSNENLAKAELSPEIPCWDEDQQTVIRLPVSVVNTFPGTDRPLLPSSNSFTPHRLPPKRIIFPLCPDHLITLLQYNVLRAGITNRRLLSPLDTPPDCSAEPIRVLSTPSSSNDIPPSLYPTYLQQTVPHENWVDIIPHPQWRDNLILLDGQFDDDQLWSDTIGGLFEGFPQSEIERRGIIVWATPWDVSGWEITEGFWRNWGWSMKGCEDIMEATNFWRKNRGEEPLDY